MRSTNPSYNDLLPFSSSPSPGRSLNLGSILAAKNVYNTTAVAKYPKQYKHALLRNQAPLPTPLPSNPTPVQNPSSSVRNPPTKQTIPPLAPNRLLSLSTSSLAGNPNAPTSTATPGTTASTSLKHRATSSIALISRNVSVSSGLVKYASASTLTPMTKLAPAQNMSTLLMRITAGCRPKAA